MQVVVMQPTYLPWCGYFDLWDQADAFVFLDHVQLVKRSWDVRNKVRTAEGFCFLTVPLVRSTHRSDLTFINSVPDYSQEWNAKHWKTIEMAYGKCPYFDEIAQSLFEVIGGQASTLAELNIEIIKALASTLGIFSGKKIYRSSELLPLHGGKDVLLCSICEKVGATRYLSPLGSMDYINLNSVGGEFQKKGLPLLYQNFSHPEYTQRYSPFVSHMSVIDIIANLGREEALTQIRFSREKPFPFDFVRPQLS